MIKTLYPIFQHWSEKGSVYLLSDTHFADSDCKLMDPDWITPEEQINQVNRWTVPLIFAITSCIGFLLFLILKKKKDENDEE